jgi:hypothetical protein
MTPDEARLHELERRLEALLRRVEELERQVARERQAQLQLDRGT